MSGKNLHNKFRNNNKPGHVNKFRTNNKAQDWGKVKFNPMKQLAAATPWTQFKNEMTQQPAEDEKETEEQKAFMKMREINYRKMIIEEKRNEPTTWENFEDDKEEPRKAKYTRKERITEKDLEDFDAKKLSFEKKNHLRQTITRAVSLKFNSLERAVENLQNRKDKQMKRNPFA